MYVLIYATSYMLVYYMEVYPAAMELYDKGLAEAKTRTFTTEETVYIPRFMIYSIPRYTTSVETECHDLED